MPPLVPDRTETLAPRADTEPSQGDARPEPVPIVLGADDPDRYEAVREHARGGLGRVVRAVDRRLNRTVAVKELLARRGTGDEARFLREAMITARLEHPGIVPVHEAGRWPNGDPYYVMKLVEGRTLKELIAARAALRERLPLLPNVIAVADAVGYAHSQGVIHRDIKPSNVIVGEFGETVVVDWGLARDRKRDVPEPCEEIILAAGSGVSTVSGKVVGTPAYMSPEQARGDLVDERADVYAIGAVLYELLAGVPPHHDDTPQATLERVIAGPPRPLALTPHVPSELATIVSKAMARDPSDRYINATALAEDLRRFQAGKLVSAHSYTTWSLIRKKLAQHRGVVAMAAASALVLAGVGVASVTRVVAERNNAQASSVQAAIAQGQAEKRQRELVLLQAVTSLRKDPTATLAWLKTAAIEDADRAQVQEVVDEAVALGVAKHVFRPNAWVFDSAFTPDGTRVVVGVRDGTVRVYDLHTGAETVLGKARSTIEAMALSPDGSVAVTGGVLGEVTVWPVDGSSPPRVVGNGGRMVWSIALSTDGKRALVQRETGAPEIVPLDGGPVTTRGPKMHRAAVALGDWSREVVSTAPNKVAVVAPNDVLRPLAQTTRAIYKIVLSPPGDLVLLHDGVAIWAVPFAGGKLEKLVDYDAKINEIVWSPDCRTIAIAGELRDVVLVDLATKLPHFLRGHTDSIYTVQWTRDGRRLLSASDDSTARVWNISDDTAIVLHGHDDDVYHARLSADERMVTTASLDGSVRVWEIESPGARVLVEGNAIESMDLAGDRALVTTKSEVSRWDLATGRRESVFSWASDPNLGLGLVSPNGERLLVPGADWSLEVRRRDGGKPVMLRGHHTVISHVEYSRDSKLVYTSSFDGTLRRWNLDTGESQILIDGTVPLSGFAVAADGRVAAQVGDATKLVAPDGTITELGQGQSWCVNYAEFDKVRDRLLIRRCNLSLVMIDGDRQIELPTDNSHVTRLAVSADGSQIAGAMGDRTVRVWDAETGRVLHVLRGHTDLVMDVAFSPDGTTLSSASYDKTVRVWELATERHRVLRGHALSVNRVAWRDARRLVTASRDGTLRVWDVPTMDLPTPAELGQQITAATSAVIDVDRPTTRPVPRGT